MSAELKAGFEKVKDNNDPTNWVVYGLEDKKLALKATGTGGRNEFQSFFGDNVDKILIGGLRVHAVDDRGTVQSVRVKFIMVKWVGSKVPTMQKGQIMQMASEIDSIMKGYHVTIQTSDSADLEERGLVAKLNESTGAHKPSGYDFNPGLLKGGEGDSSSSGATLTPANVASASPPERTAAADPPSPKVTSPATTKPATTTSAAAPAPAKWEEVKLDDASDFNDGHQYRLRADDSWYYAVRVSPKLLLFATPNADGHYGGVAHDARAVLSIISRADGSSKLEGGASVAALQSRA